MIKGIHHISMKCCSKEQLQKVRDFYCGILELPVWSEWDGGIMIETPAGKIEIFMGPKEVVLGEHTNYVAFCHGPLGEDVEFFMPVN